MEPLKVKLLPSELPGLRYRQQCLSPPTQPPQVRSNGPFSAQPFCADICSHPLLLGGRPLARPWVQPRWNSVQPSLQTEAHQTRVVRAPRGPGPAPIHTRRPQPAPSALTVKRPRRTQPLAS